MPTKSIHQPVMSVSEIESFLDSIFPQLQHDGERAIRVEAVGPMTARIRLLAHERHLRPGNTISGPAMFMLADVSVYIAILAHIGREALAVTSNLNINFLRRPPHGDMIAHCRLLKLGKRLAVGEAALFADGGDEPVAHAVATYSIPVVRPAPHK
jgi:uncharacterized protein (TIGR00369 family)